MGKKNRKQREAAAAKLRSTDEKKLSKSEEKQVDDLVKSLFELCSKVNPPGLKDVEEFDSIYEIVSNIRKIQSEVASKPPERTKENLDAFTDWLRSTGVNLSAVEISNFSDVGYGLKAVNDMKEADPIVNIPRKLMLTTDTAQDSVLGPIIKVDKILQAMPNIVLALHLLCEKRSPNSFWRKYIDILPADYNTPLYFTPEEIKALKGSPAQRDCASHCRNIARQYSYLYRLIHNNSLASNLPIRNNFTYDDYRWAVSSVMTRQNQIPSKDKKQGILALIPMWDMCNHCNGTITTDYNTEQDCCECFALKAFKAGEQVFIFYGARSNAELLVHNGFVYLENELDRMALKLGISKSDPMFNEKSELLTMINLSASRNYFLHRGNIPLDPQILAFLRVFAMTEEDMKNVHQRYSEPQTLMHFLGDIDSRVSKENEEKLWSFLETRTNLLLKAYPSTLEEDEQLLLKSDIKEHMRLVVQLRLCEKRILQSALVYATTKKNEISLEDVKISNE